MAIIGISGKIGSGKDTVGKIIQYLESTNNLKNVASFEDCLINDSSFISSNSGWEIKKMAGKLKEVISLLTGIPVEDLEKQEVKDSFLGPEWSTFIGLSEVMKDGIGRRPYTVRELLQKVGTEAMRNQIHQNVWVNALFADYKEDTGYKYDVEMLGGLGMSGNQKLLIKSNPERYNNGYPKWIITDIRFPNEAEAIKQRGGVLIRINRPCTSCGVYNNIACNKCSHSNLHSSETSLDNYEKFDYVIYNDGSLEDLVKYVSVIYQVIQQKWHQ